MKMEPTVIVVVSLIVVLALVTHRLGSALEAILKSASR